LQRLSIRLRASTAWVPVFLVSGMIVGCLLYASPVLRTVKTSAQPRFHEDAVARAAGRSMLGPNAFVASRNAIMWFASGAAHYHNVDSELLWPGRPPAMLSEYFSVFDAIVDHQAASGDTLNTEHKSLVSWYVDGTLKLRGMYLSSDLTLPYLMLS